MYAQQIPRARKTFRKIWKSLSGKTAMAAILPASWNPRRVDSLYCSAPAKTMLWTVPRWDIVATHRISGEQTTHRARFRDAPDGENVRCIAHVRAVFAACFVDIIEGALHYPFKP